MCFKKCADARVCALSAGAIGVFLLLWVLLGHAPGLGSSLAFGCLPSAPSAALDPGGICFAIAGDSGFLFYN